MMNKKKNSWYSIIPQEVGFVQTYISFYEQDEGVDCG